MLSGASLGSPRGASSSSTGAEAGQTYSLHIHDINFSTDELVLNPEAFPHVSVNDVLEICASHAAAEGGGGAAQQQQQQQQQGRTSNRRASSLFLQVIIHVVLERR